MKIDELKDENVTLKLRLSDLEGDILEERQSKQLKYDMSVDAMRASMQDQILEQKVKFEENLMGEKERNYKLKIEIQGLNERNQLLKDQIMVFRDRITELEKENIIQSKENYILNSELDYNQAKTQQLQQKNEDILSGVNTNKMADVKARDRLISEYERRIDEYDMKLRLTQKLTGDSMSFEMQKIEMDKVNNENRMLKSDL